MSDFRSDTVTRPSPAMKQAMMEAPLGDDVFGDDPTVNRLQEMAAEMLGFEAALFAASGTQSNLIALMTHCQRGDEAIVGQQWHTYRWEAGGMAVLGSIQPQPLENQADGTIALTDIEAAIKPDDPHFARTRLIGLENTTGGKVLPLQYMRDVRALAERRGLRTHIDGARLFNAAVASCDPSGGNPLQQAREICTGYDSVSLCLSKGLGAPVGSVLLGSAEFIAQARRNRKMLGGGMRQAGILAAAGIYALQNNVRRLAEDHRHASLLHKGLSRIAASHSRLAGRMTVHPVQTNILFMDVELEVGDALLTHLAANDIRVTGGYQRSKDLTLKRIRWVTHLDVGPADVERALATVEKF
ncbi:MAG: low-specificity L-threonine aldolase [Sulfuritalea sp.]|nr:low-specificity L-threonine aldolase [Sulfuritalea sp.]